MKKIILLSLCLLAGAASLSAQKTLYVIDNETFEHFDGSQLKGKTVKDYKITTTGKGRHAVTVHAIQTGRPNFFISGPLSGRDSLHTGFLEELPQFRADSIMLSKDVNLFYRGPKKMVYVIDGVKHEDVSAVQSIPTQNISSIKVLKNGSPEQQQYGEDCPVILIETKKQAGLKELIKTLPGAKVEADGSVTVNGQPVKKITVNGRTYTVDAPTRPEPSAER